jgi:predicted dehydrogenase
MVMATSKVKVGVIGCGDISKIYLRNLPTFSVIEVVACADILFDRAKTRASEFNIKPMLVDTLLHNTGIDLIVNLTVPKAHAQVNLTALQAGKHVYTEKPLATSFEEGLKTVDLARENGLRVGSAPDTFLGGGLQTCRKLIDQGAIGYPIAAVAFMMGHGMETWHPNPEFFYKTGGGPMLDMGPYYLTALVSLLGPIRRITGSTRISFPERIVTSQANYGKRITVETPTHVSGLIDFANGTIGTIVTSFDVWGANLPRIEIFGSEGTLSLPDPNSFKGPVRLFQPGKDWQEIDIVHGYTDNSRGLGVADMAQASISGRAHRASGDLALHILESMLSFEKASRSGEHVLLQTTCDRPDPLPPNLLPGQVPE